ncbi:MAG: response regulator [Planctomycetaceae bacterium]|jgi:signal transduction histidine kinase/CheY-like chemotaxis protein|nr:response regulator [Planctomycetaceae bacterium]
MTVEPTTIQHEKEFCYISLIAEIRKSLYHQNEQESIQTFLDSVTRLFPLAKAWYGTYSGNTLRPIIHAGTAKDCIDFVQITGTTETETETSNNSFPLFRAITEHQPIAVHHLDPQEQFLQWKTFLENSQCRSILAIPVEIQDKIEAGIVFYSFSPDPFDPITMDYLVRSVRELIEIISAKRLRSKQLRELRKAKEFAETQALVKTRFLANMSHEIRTPMTAILGFTEILLRDHLTPFQNETEETEKTKNLPTLEFCLKTLRYCKNTTQIIQSNAEFLLSILNDILEFSKLEAGMLKVEKIAVPIQPFFRELAMLYSVQTQAKNLTFSIKILTPLPILMNTDPLRLKQILMNLIGNAIKFTQQGGITISIAWVPADPKDTAKEEEQQYKYHHKHQKNVIVEGSLFFSVKDTGIGISQKILSTLFVPFRQADSETTRRFGGSGLGLVISKRLIRLLDGEMIVKSREGLGSTFTVVLPQQFDHEIPFESFPADFGNNMSLSEMPDLPVSNSATKAPSCRLTERRILLAEDNKDIRRLFSLIMKKEGAEIIEADNGQIAVEIVMENLKNDLLFDMILMDMEMPVMDGYTATRQLREKGYTNPIIALTAHALSEEHQKCLDAGCNDYIIKPILRDALIAAVLKHFT